nr:tRNA adenosine(34) deaminase TadA [Pasteuria penetrans]
MSDSLHHHFMRLALQEADEAARQGEIPVGAVVVQNERNLLARGHNQREKAQDPLAHAEMIVIRQASQRLQSWRLLDTTLYVTLEPCPMCAGAILQARMGRLVYGTRDPKAGCAGTLYNLLVDTRFNHQTQVTGGILADSCAQRLRDFFATLRRRL